VSQNTLLEGLKCSQNRIESLDISKNRNLKELELDRSVKELKKITSSFIDMDIMIGLNIEWK
jgi:hypothetical protein